MKNTGKTAIFTGKAVLTGAAFAFAVMPHVPAHAQNAKTYVMKLSTATLNDTQHE